MPSRVYMESRDHLGERTKEVWDDEEDIEAAVKRLVPSHATADAGKLLLTEVNQLYVKQQFPDGYVGPLELRYIEGRGYSLFTTTKVEQGEVLAVCPPLTWLAGKPGEPPSLSDLITHMRNSSFTARQRQVLLSLCSLPSLDQQHDEQQRQQRQRQEADSVLAAAQKLQQDQGYVGVSSSSLPMSKSAQIQAMQRKLKEQRGFLNYQDNEEDEEDEEDYPQLGATGGSSTSISSLVHSSSSSKSGRGMQQKPYMHERAAPDLLDLLECTKEPAPDAAAAAVAGSTDLTPTTTAGSSAGKKAWGAGWSKRGGSSSTREALVAGSRHVPLDLPLDRLTALVCRNALTELSQDLAASIIRGDQLTSVTGIWPLLTQFSHSCAANAVAVVLGDVPEPPQQTQQQLSAGTKPLNALVTAALKRKSPHSAAAAAVSATAGVPANPWTNSRRAHQRRPSTQDTTTSSSSSKQQQLAHVRQLPASVQSWSVGAPSGSSSSGPFVLVRAVTSMEPGVEVTLDYLSSFAEGSFVDGERRRTALAKRWGFTCRCERCTSEQQLNLIIRRGQQTVNTLAADLGPEVTAAAAETTLARKAGGAGAADAGLQGDAGDVLRAAIGQLRQAVQLVEEQLNQPSIPGRVAAWAHASTYQAHALSALAKMALQPADLSSLAAVGTCMELLGKTAPGSSAHLLTAAGLMNAAMDTWGEGDERVEATARNMLQVLQLRYGPLEAAVAHRLATAAQFWASEAAQTRLGLLSPAASAAAQARKRQQELAAAATSHAATSSSSSSSNGSVAKGDNLRPSAAAAAGSAAGTAAGTAAAASQQGEMLWQQRQTQEQREGDEEEEEEVDELATALELEAEAVLEVTDELLDELYGTGPRSPQREEGAGHAAAAASGHAAGSGGLDTAAAAEAGTGAGAGAGACRIEQCVAAGAAGSFNGISSARDDEDRDGLAFVRQRSEAEVLSELQLFAGVQEQLSPAQKQELWQQQQQQQEAAASRPSRAAVAGVDDGAVAAAGDAEANAEEVALEELPVLTSWLQSDAQVAADVAGAEELLQQQQPPQPWPQQQGMQQQPGSPPGMAGQQQRQQQQQQQQSRPVQPRAAVTGLRERMAAAAAAAAAKPSANSGGSSRATMPVARVERPKKGNAQSAAAANVPKPPPPATEGSAGGRVAAPGSRSAFIAKQAAVGRPLSDLLQSGEVQQGFFQAIPPQQQQQQQARRTAGPPRGGRQQQAPVNRRSQQQKAGSAAGACADVPAADGVADSTSADGGGVSQQQQQQRQQHK